MKSSQLVFIPAIACALLAGCAASVESGNSSAPFVDAEGHAVELTGLPVKRIVSTMQSATEWLIELGAADLLVARTDFDRDSILASLPSIGGGNDPSPEAIAALHPDVVIGWQNRSSVNLQSALKPFKIPVIAFETADTSDLFRHLASLGHIIGRSARADSLAAQVRADLAEIHASSCTEAERNAKQTAMVILWTEPAMTAGGPSWLSMLLDTACLANAFGDVTKAWPTVAMESIIAKQPDWLVTSVGAPGQRLTELRALPGWKDLEAVKKGRVIEIPGDLLSRAGPHIAEAARALVAARKALP